jgi:hypothetical protein
MVRNELGFARQKGNVLLEIANECVAFVSGAALELERKVGFHGLMERKIRKREWKV